MSIGKTLRRSPSISPFNPALIFGQASVTRTSIKTASEQSPCSQSRGILQDTSGQTGTISGTFTSQFGGLNPQQTLAVLEGGGNAPYSGILYRESDRDRSRTATVTLALLGCQFWPFVASSASHPLGGHALGIDLYEAIPALATAHGESKLRDYPSSGKSWYAGHRLSSSGWETARGCPAYAGFVALAQNRSLDSGKRG
jgi:hypothetical protein